MPSNSAFFAFFNVVFFAEMDYQSHIIHVNSTFKRVHATPRAIYPSDFRKLGGSMIIKGSISFVHNPILRTD